ncbi:MAG TPA: transposase, partial [Lysobacter sp.]|nr:transposase [Lysobacter sp.]
MTNPKLLRGRTSEIEGYFAITTVVLNRRPLLQDAETARIAISEIDNCIADGFVESLAWVVMPDHLHWLFVLKTGRLGDVIQAMKSRGARAINVAKGSQGQFWQRGFYDHRLR